MKMVGLAVLYKSMREQELNYTIFDYIHNRIKLSILFDIGENPFRLLLIKQGSLLVLLLEVKKGFILDTHLENEKYKTLREMLEIKKG